MENTPSKNLTEEKITLVDILRDMNTQLRNANIKAVELCDRLNTASIGDSFSFEFKNVDPDIPINQRTQSIKEEIRSLHELIDSLAIMISHIA